MLTCTGRRIEGAKTPLCGKLCAVRNCAQMDGCSTLGRISANNPPALENLKRLRRSKQDEAETAETEFMEKHPALKDACDTVLPLNCLD